ncbi:hypothetical protein E2C01_097092 [Portunus trituberculatus]|uniref:Uncharacterized protein n=1 Tax=Portunus trituberculatus TaxID=210409 RepID=A0A5B7K8M2_PORTR|nr:hypothetical protein [Portunus trituberculatus]
MRAPVAPTGIASVFSLFAVRCRWMAVDGLVVEIEGGAMWGGALVSHPGALSHGSAFTPAHASPPPTASTPFSKDTNYKESKLKRNEEIYMASSVQSLALAWDVRKWRGWCGGRVQVGHVLWEGWRPLREGGARGSWEGKIN